MCWKEEGEGRVCWNLEKRKGENMRHRKEKGECVGGRIWVRTVVGVGRKRSVRERRN